MGDPGGRDEDDPRVDASTENGRSEYDPGVDASAEEHDPDVDASAENGRNEYDLDVDASEENGRDKDDPEVDAPAEENVWNLDATLAESGESTSISRITRLYTCLFLDLLTQDLADSGIYPWTNHLKFSRTSNGSFPLSLVDVIGSLSFAERTSSEAEGFGGMIIKQTHRLATRFTSTSTLNQVRVSWIGWITSSELIVSLAQGDASVTPRANHRVPSPYRDHDQGTRKLTIPCAP